MTATTRRRARPAPLVALVGVLALVALPQITGLVPGQAGAGLEEPLLDMPPAAQEIAMAGDASSDDGAAGADSAAGATIGPAASDLDPNDPVAEELARIRADIDFWGARLTAMPTDLVAAVKLAESHVAEARLTGNVTAYLRAEAAADAALVAHPTYPPALGMRATILVALHRFPEARDLANRLIRQAPGDATALGVLGDASLELGDLDTAGRAYGELGSDPGGSAALVRAGRLAFMIGDTAGAVAANRAAVEAAVDEGLEGNALGFYHVTLGETLLATGDAAGAREAYTAAFDARPGLPAALAGLARLDAFRGDLDGAIDRLDAAIAAIPLPDFLARRSDLFALRDGPGDAALAAADLATVEAVAGLAGDAATVYDRGLVLHLADHGLEPERAVRLATDELAVRHDVYGQDALAWALLNAGRPAEAASPMAAALAAGTRDARLWYHAGLVAAANGESDAARAYLRDALALGPALDPVARARATSSLETLR
ncbi:MAG TPA: tetratricopeptide repeat protein [Candidatus Limnocylindrales bacterium]|nr:tetratricopeptide repeat protein [Candidatus Limnocylindrales bacterium]